MIQGPPLPGPPYRASLLRRADLGPSRAGFGFGWRLAFCFRLAFGLILDFWAGFGAGCCWIFLSFAMILIGFGLILLDFGWIWLDFGWIWLDFC